MASGIEKVDIILSNQGTEWHGMARVVENITEADADELLFPIIQSPALVKVDGNEVMLPNYKVLCADLRNHRPDLDESERIHPLHIPKAGYQVIDNRQIWESMDKALTGCGAKITSVGTLEGLKKFFISADIGGSDMVINGDQFKCFVNFVTSHDGTIAMSAYDSSIRIVCMNTLRWSMKAQGDVNFKVYHTKNADLALSNLPDLLNAILKGRADLKQVMEYLDTCLVDSNDAVAMAAGYFCMSTGSSDLKLSTRSVNASQEIGTLFTNGIGCKGRTLYDLANAATQYWTTGNGTGKKESGSGSRLYRSSMGSAADHKQAFVEALQDDRLGMLSTGREAMKIAMAKS